MGTSISRATGDISVRGQAGARPRLTFSGGANLSLKTSGSLSNLELRGACGAFVLGVSACVDFPGAGVIDRLLIDITGDLIAGIDVVDATVRNSAVRLAGPPPGGGGQQSVIAIAAHGPAQVRNVTAIATGAQSIGIAAGTSFGPAAYTTQVTNAVARGDRSDLGAFGTAPASVTLAVTHSNYVTAGNVSLTPSPGIAVVPTAPNQASGAAFVDTALPDYHLAPGSPLIDAGVDSPANGPLDLDGGARSVGAATDIGAYEFTPPPTPATPAAAPAPPTAGPAPTAEQQRAGLRAAVADDLPATLPRATGALITLNLDGLPPGTSAAGEVQTSIPGKTPAAKTLIVAKGTSTANAAGSARLPLRVTARGRALLRKLRRAAKARLVVRLKRPGNVTVTITKPVKLRRPSR